MARYLVVDYGYGHNGHVVAAAWVRAESAWEAARLGRIALEAENGDGDFEYPGNVAVVEADKATWFAFEHTPRLAELQCCGGADTEDGHTGHCDRDLH